MVLLPFLLSVELLNCSLSILFFYSSFFGGLHEILFFSKFLNYSFLFALFKESFYSSHWILVGTRSNCDMGWASALWYKYFCNFFIFISFVVISITILAVLGISLIGHLFLLTIRCLRKLMLGCRRIELCHRQAIRLPP